MNETSAHAGGATRTRAAGVTADARPPRGFVVLLPALGALAAAGAANAQPAPRETRTASAVLAPDAYFVQFGRARETTAVVLGLLWDWRRPWRAGERSLVSVYGELSIGHWRADQRGGRAVVTQVGFTPTFRYWPAGSKSGAFFEGAVGVNVLTPVYRTRHKRFSTALNFGDHVAFGYRSPGASGWELSLRLQHFSNAGIDRPNPGENFVQLRLTLPLAHVDA